MNIRYTLCFIRRGDELLMLLRNNPPNQGLYNGVGGKIEPGELPLASVLREVREETGITLTTARFGGIVTWGEGDGYGGMYVYTAEFPDDIARLAHHGRLTDEGMLRWMSVEDVLSHYEIFVVSNIPSFLPPMLEGRDRPKEYRCSYHEWRLTGVQVYSVSAKTMRHATATE